MEWYDFVRFLDVGVGVLCFVFFCDVVYYDCCLGFGDGKEVDDLDDVVKD